jgi:hypothetical protein
MFKANLKPRHKVVDSKKAMRFAAFAFFLFIAIHPAQGQTNVVSGIAYGTNDLSVATSIASIEDGAGTLLIGFSSTTNLALGHDISGFIVITNQAADFSIAATTNAVVTSSAGPALTVINATNLSLTGGRYLGEATSGDGEFPPIPGVEGTAVGGLLRNSTATIDGSEFAGAAGNAGMVVQASDLIVTDGSFIGGAGAAGLFAVSNSTVTINSGSFTGVVGMAVQESTLIINDGIFSGGEGGAGLFAISNSIVTINDGSFTGGKNAEALYASNSDVTIEAGTFSGAENAEVLYAINSDVTINDGSFTGGGNAEALYAINSDVTIEDGTFNGGMNAAALYAENGDLTINGGTFQGGAFGADSYFGLVSIADAAQTNNITLNGGSFSSIDFAGSGVQILTAGAGVQVDDYVVLDGGALIVDNTSSSAFQNLWIRGGNIRFLNDYSLFSGGRLELLTSTNNAVAPFFADTATFETNSTIDVDASLSNFSTGTNDVVLVSTENGLSVIDAGGNTNSATDANLEENVNLTATTVGRTVLSEVLVVGSTNLVYRFTTESLKDYWNAKGPFGVFADELESLITPEMDTIINLIDNPAISSRAVQQTYFTTFNSFQTALQGMRAAVGQSVARGTQLRDQKRMVPRGARGPTRQPGLPESRIRGWGKYYGNYYTHSDSGLYPSYDSRIHGGVVGIDTSIGKLIIGISGGASQYNTDFDGGGNENTTAAHGNLYGTYGAERGYIDAGIAYGWNQVDTRTADPFRLDGDYDAQLANAYLGGGYDLIDTKGGTVFTPEIAIQYAKYKQDSYTEKGTAAVPRVFDDFDSDSLLSSVGMNVAMQKKRAMKTFAYQLDGRLHWMHEFNPEPSNLDFRLAGGSNSYQLDYPSLDEEIYRIGIGCSFFNTGRQKPRNVVFRVDFDELFGDDFNSHNLSVKVFYAF